MLSPNEFFAGQLQIAKPISLFLDLDDHSSILVGGSADQPVGIFLDGEVAHDYLLTKEKDWTGLVIPDLQIELDETSVYDARTERVLGAAVRTEKDLSICVKRQRQNGVTFIPLVPGLPSVGELRVGFRRWSLMLGQGRDKRIMRCFDVSGA